MSKKYFFLGTSKENTKLLTNFNGGIYGKRNKTLGVVAHDGGSGMPATAYQVALGTINAMKNDSNYPNYHNVVDDEECYAVVNQENATYSLGDSNPNDSFYPNDLYISIEIAPSLRSGENFKNQAEKDKYKKAWQNACKLVADYCVFYNLSHNDVHQHREFSATGCPYTMMKYFGSYEKALSETKKEVKKNIETIKNGGVQMKKKINVHTFKNKYGVHYINYSEFEVGKRTEIILQHQKSLIDVNKDRTYLLTAHKPIKTYSDKALTKQDGTLQKGNSEITQHSHMLEV